MIRTAEEILEFEQVAGIVRRYVTSPLGMAELEGLRPSANQADAEHELAAVGEAMAYLQSVERDQAVARSPRPGGQPLAAIGFHGLHDVREAAAKLAIEGVELEPAEIYHLLALLERAGDIKSVLAASAPRFPLLAAIGGAIGEFRPVLRDLSGKILPNGQLEDHASGALRRIRREMAQQTHAIRESLDRFMRLHSEEGSLQEDYVTIRNDRLVVPVKSAEKRRIEGVIHAASSTGQTLFVEPLETIDLNNGLVRLSEEELREIHRILREMTARLAHYADAISASVRALAKLELLIARARFGVEFGAVIPRFSAPDSPRLHLREARHPLLEDLLKRRGQAVVPASLTLDSGHRMLIISGPNTGGKTVALKTAGLLALMAQAGLPSPAEEAEFPWFEQVLADIGDAQSIQESLSSFSAHLASIREMIESDTSRSLVLIDEMGAATDPQEGGALGVAVADHFRKTGAFTMVSTHLPALKIYGANTPGVLSASLGFNEETLAPDYRLAVGLPGKSAGLDIARRLGIPSPIIERAQQALTSQDREIAALLGELHQRVAACQAAEQDFHQRREELERREKEIKAESEKREAAKLKELERRVDATLDRFNTEAKQTIDKIAQSALGRKAASEATRDATRQTARAGRQLREQFEATVLETIDDARQGMVKRSLGPIEAGSMIKLRDVASPARVRRTLGDDKIEVEVGFMKMQVGLDDVLEVLPGGAGAKPAKSLPSGVSFHAAAPVSGASLGEINVIGLKAEEARERVDKFLDTAVMSATPRVRVIHGHGMGILRRTLSEMFGSHPHVEKFYAAEQREGGAGATIVELKL